MNKHRDPERRNRRIEDYPKRCMFCAKEIPDDEFSREHSPPKCFYEKLLRNDVDLKGLELPAHKNCNNSFSGDNEYVRNILAGVLGAENSSGAKALVNGVIPIFMKNSTPKKLEATYKKVKLRPAYSNSGIFLGNKPSIEVEWSRIERVLFNMIKGIYYKVSMQPMPTNFHLLVLDASVLPSEVVHHDVEQMVHWQSIKGDPEVFRCRYKIQRNNTEAIFLINLFNYFYFWGEALSPEALKKYQNKELFKPSSPKSKILVPYYLAY